MTPECAATVVHITDLDASIRYYTTVLGFQLDFQAGHLAGIQYGNVFIHLSAPAEFVNTRAIGEGHLYVFCDEVDEYYTDITNKGAISICAPGDRHYNMRDFAIKDLDGNILSFGKSLV